MMSPSDLEAQVYVVTDITTKNIATVNWPEGTTRLTKQLSPGHTPTFVAWIPDTNLCLVLSREKSFFITNFMEQVFPSLHYSFPHADHEFSYSSFISNKRRIALIPVFHQGRTIIYKISEEYPCSGLCLTCDLIDRAKCTSCQAKSEPTASGDSCQCISNYYKQLKSFSISSCLQCSELCQECTGGKTTDCTTCKFPTIMDKKSDGSCGCKDGSYDNSETTCTACHSSCLTCSKGGE